MPDEKNDEHGDNGSDSRQPIEGSFAVKRILVDPSANPRVAHFLTWTRVGHEYTLDIGHFDPASARQALLINAGRPEEVDRNPVDVYVTHQFALSLETMERFLLGLDDMKRDLETLKARDHAATTGEKESDDREAEE